MCLELQLTYTLPASLTDRVSHVTAALQSNRTVLLLLNKKRQNEVMEDVAAPLNEFAEQASFGVTRLFLFIPNLQIHLNMCYMFTN